MKRALSLLVLLAAAHAQAAILAEAPMEGDAVVYLHDVAGPCLGDAKLAEYITAAGERTPGCWVRRADHIAVVFLDGDVGTIPARVLRKPKGA